MIDAEMRNGGAAAFLHDLLALDISGVDFSKPPMTEGLQQQIQLGFTAEEKWLESTLAEGRLPFKQYDGRADDVEWPEGIPFELVKDIVIQSYRDFVPGFRSPPTPQAVGTYLNKALPGLKEKRRSERGSRVRYWVLPSLIDARKAFIEQHPGYTFVADLLDLQQARTVHKF